MSSIDEFIDEQFNYLLSRYTDYMLSQNPQKGVFDLITHKNLLKAKFLEVENEAIQRELEPSNQLLRSAYQIARRDGKDVNWFAFQKQVDAELKRQHQILYTNSKLTPNSERGK